MPHRSSFIIERDTLEILLDLPDGFTLVRADTDELNEDQFIFTVEGDAGLPSGEGAVATYAPNDVGSLTLVGIGSPE